MKKQLLLSGLLLAGLTACSPNSSLESTLSKNNWKVAWYGDISQPTGIADNSKITFAFVTGGYDNNLQVKSGCHQIIGHYQLKDGQIIEMKEIELSRNGENCQDPNGQMDAILALLKGNIQVDALSGGNLLLKKDQFAIRLEQSWE